MARPREFDPVTALEDIMNVFWEKGYAGASLDEIEKATNLNKQSLYRVFGGKREMYLAALRRYEEKEVAQAIDTLKAAGSAKDRIGRLFDGLLQTAATNRRGCFLCNAGIDQAQVDLETHKAVNGQIEKIKRAISAALSVSAPYKQHTSLRNKKAAELLAGYFGLRVLVKAGAPIAMLKGTARQILSGI
ncbi:MAG: TetR/AcrR family transcriptional regulator [Hyphococcus sp.]